VSYRSFEEITKDYQSLEKYYNSLLINKLIRKALTSALVNESMAGYVTKEKIIMNDSLEE
jgi:hypothetical protein